MVDQQTGRVLVVEDEDDLATLVELNLQLAGHDVEIAVNGERALAQIEASPPDVVLLDVMMPVMDGWQVLRELKASAETQDIPVIMLTALAEERDLIRGHLQGAVRYITKPFEMRGLLDTVAEALLPPTDDQLAQRRVRTRQLLQRLAELDSGRSADGPTVRLSQLEQLHRDSDEPADAPPRPDPALLDELTESQRHVMQQLAAGVSARAIANDLDVSRSNVYAIRKRIARKLGVAPDDVPGVARDLLGSEAS